MKSVLHRPTLHRNWLNRLPLFFCALVLCLSGCAAQKSSQNSMIVLFPENGKVSGQVMVQNAQGSQLLSQSWQSVEIAGPGSQPGSPKQLDRAVVQDVFGKVLAATPLAPVHYQLFFRLDSTELLPDSHSLLPAIAKSVKERQPAQLSVVGHTDTMGSAAYNYQLGLLRARALIELLTSQGVTPESVEISSRGKTELLVKTPDQTLEPRNRRAEVTIH